MRQAHNQITYLFEFGCVGVLSSEKCVMYFILGFTLGLTLLTSYIVLYISFCLWRPSKKPPDMTFTTPQAIHSLLDPPGTTTTTLLRCRAIPNARLIRAFGIHNSAFTSPSTEVWNAFRKNSKARLRAFESQDKWDILREVIEGAIEFYLPDAHLSGDYGAFMQAIVFVTVLSAFFEQPDPVSFPEASSVRFVTEGISTLWMASKSPTFRSGSPILARINQHLHEWLPDDPKDPFCNNPLEIILPAYETLWRLVADAYVYLEGSPNYILPLLDFFDNPTANQFRTPAVEETPTPQDIINEVLRLHPPTKRIKRNIPTPSSPPWARRLFAATGFSCEVSDNTVAADIEALQRSSVWAPSPHDFDAMRHKASTEAQRECFMPFGAGPLKCVASSLAPRLAGVIIAGVLKREDVQLIRGESKGGREGWAGWKIYKMSV
ncbi:hypothetical protein K439DRAFT_300524 [Ramaria rubella]|nr:hypothetical protein K439DRAFT_300524 [Ramaria rubella]